MIERKGNPLSFLAEINMITMTKLTDAQKLREICEREGVEYTEKIMAITAVDKDEMLGYSLFLAEDKLCIINISTSPMLWNIIGDGLFRATLNFGAENGISSAKIEKNLLEKLKGNVIPSDKATENIQDCEAFLQDIKKCGR